MTLLSPFEEDLPVIATDDSGMVADDERPCSKDASDGRVKGKKKRRPRKYVSKHFQISASITIETAAAPSPKQQIIAGVNIDELSSDSPLTDVPSDIGSDP